MDITTEDFDEEFSTFGVNVGNDDLYDSLRLMCHQYRLDASEIAIEWLAYSHSHSNCKLTSESLGHLERERLSKKKTGKGGKTPKSAKVRKEVTYDVISLQEDATEDLVDAYATPKGKTPNKRQHTPDQPINKRIANLGGTNQSAIPVAPFSPSSFSPSAATPSKKYSSRTNVGEVVFTYGNCKNINWGSKQKDPTTIVPYDSDTSLSKKFKYMFQKLSDKAIVLNDTIEIMSEKLQKHYKVAELSHVALPSQESVVVSGRIECDSQGRLNAKSIVLEGSQETSSGKRIPLDVSEIPSYSLFPGQVVMLDSINTTGQQMQASKLYPCVMPDAATGSDTVPAEGLRIVIASGPFSTSDSLMYEPLADLIKKLQRDPPDVAVLIGPFVDIKNPEIESGQLNVTYEAFFERTIEQLRVAVSKLPTQLVIIPSQRDAHHEPVYPQPPFMPSTTAENDKIHFASDPCMLKIAGLVFGITSTDILFHIGLQEISIGPQVSGNDRLGRLAQHLLNQHSFYPLYPPSENVNIDWDHFDIYAKMNVRPDVLILPSDLRYFVKDLSGCLCVNPGHLAKEQVGGTFVRMKVMPRSGKEKSLTESISAEVIRI